MKPFHLKHIRTFSTPYSKELSEMLSVTKERSVTFQNGVRGFIVGQHVFAPYHQKESCIVEKEGHKLVLTYVKTDKWGISHFLLPFDIPCEPLHFRHTPIHRDTFLFRVFNQVNLCEKFPVQTGKGQYGLDSLDQFCPVFDRHCHLIGLNNGVFCHQLLCLPIQLLV